MTTTTIEWTRGDDGSAGATWNPVTGCDEVSEGCDHCYAKTFAERWRGVPGHPYEQGFDVRLWPDRLGIPLRWRKPRRVFVNSMSDLFHAQVPDDFIARTWAVMGTSAAHTFQILTKRPGRMRSLLNSTDFRDMVDEHWARIMVQRPSREQFLFGTWPLPNVWLGTSVESQRWATVRLPQLAETPAAVRFASCEPLLGPLDIRRWLPNALDWVIVGGESGNGARPMWPDWARSLRDQCQDADIAFFFKQWGAWMPAGRGIGMAQHSVGREVLVGQPLDDLGQRQVMRRVGKGSAGRELDGRCWDEYPAAGREAEAVGR
jgi:protein gp37